MLFEANGRDEEAAKGSSVLGPKRSGRKTRGTLGVGPVGRGRFNNSAPTIYNGEDLDIPTFIRRNINLEP